MNVTTKPKPNGQAPEAPNADAGKIEGEVTEATESNDEPQPSERLLLESKKWKSRALESERKLKEREQKELEAQNRFKDLYETERQSKTDLLKRVMMKDISVAVERAASKAGCIDPSALFQLGNPELLQYDEESGDVQGVETFVEEVKKAKAYLFQSKTQPSINPTVPGAGGLKKTTATAADVAKLSNKEKNDAWAKAIKKKDDASKRH